MHGNSIGVIDESGRVGSVHGCIVVESLGDALQVVHTGSFVALLLNTSDRGPAEPEEQRYHDRESHCNARRLEPPNRNFRSLSRYWRPTWRLADWMNYRVLSWRLWNCNLLATADAGTVLTSEIFADNRLFVTIRAGKLKRHEFSCDTSSKVYGFSNSSL